MNNIAETVIPNKTIENESVNVEPKSIDNNGYLINNKLIVNSESGNLLNELKRCLNECERFYFSVAFINFSGLQLLLDTFKELELKGVSGKISTSTYLNFTEPKALEGIKAFSDIDLKVFIADVLKEYDNLWNSTEIVDEEFIENYSSFIKEIKKMDLLSRKEPLQIE